jgi:CO/xanthine dehydrogenase FAD-binding subunit
MPGYERPRNLGAALARRAAPCLVIAGGTDVYPARVGRAIAEDVLDVSGIAELRGIAEDGSGWRIGATTTWAAIAAAPLPPAFDGLRLAAREVGGIQIQNRGTIGGNLCNASPAADGIPPLLALDAEVELASVRGRRTLPLAAFVLGNRRTALRPDELLTAVLVPRHAGAGRSTFLKLGARRYLVISIAMVAAAVATDAVGTITRAAVAIGACSAAARRLPALEAALVGEALEPGIGALATSDHLAPLAPIDDVRGSAAYRGGAARELVARALDGLAGT